MVQKNNTARIMIGIVFGILLFTMSLSSASAATITVNASGVNAQYSTIQAAINNANESDIIEVQSGTYLENVVVNKTLSLKGIGMPLINASGSGTAITITSGGSTVDGFNVTGSGTDWNGGDAESGIKIKSDGNNVLNSSAGFNNYGVYVFESELNTIKNNSVYNNTEGIYVFYSSNNSIIENNLTLNTNRGVFVSNSNNCTISNNTVSKTIDGIYLTTSTNCSILGNIADSNTRGIYLYSNSINNFLTDNIASGNSYSGIYLSSSGSSTLTGNDASGDSEYGIRLISSSGSTLIGNNASGNSHSGIYLDSSGSSTLIGNNASGNSRYGIGLMGSDSSILTDNNVFGNGYSGISLIGSDSSTLTDNNASENGGDGIYLSGSDNSLIGNYASGNSYSGIYLYGSGSNTLKGNNASENTGYGYKFYSSSSNTLIKNNALNNGYGFYIDTSSSSNTLHKNNLIDNVYYNAYDIVGSNSWSYNHYGDYTGSDSNDDGIGDTAYYIAGDAGAKDDNPSMEQWNINVPFIYPSLPFPSSANNSYMFVINIYQIANVSWIFDGVTLQTNTSVTKASYYNSSKNYNGCNLTVVAENVNGTKYYNWTSSVEDVLEDTPAEEGPTISYNPSSSSVSNYVEDSRTFNVTVSQGTNMTWILDGITLYTNTSVKNASYYNDSAQLGTHNLTLLLENANFSESKKWTWTVTNPNLYTISLQQGWNLVSPTATPDIPDINSIFSSNSDVNLPIYTWNTVGRQYYAASTIESGQGYWIFAFNETQVVYIGTV